MVTSRLTLGTLSPRSGVVFPDVFSPLSPSLGLLLAKLRHRVRSAVLGRVGFSEVLSPFSPGLRGGVWETSLPSSWKVLDVVRRAVLLGVRLSEALPPLSPGLIGLGRAGRLRVAVLLSIKIAEVLSPFSPIYKRRKKWMIRCTPIRRPKIVGKESYFGLGQGTERERERRRERGCRWQSS